VFLAVPTNPLAIDRYAYCFNNPVRYNDPTGHDPIEVIILGFAITIGAPEIVVFGLLSILVLDVILPGADQRHQELTNSINQAWNNTINLFARKKDLGYIDYVLDKYNIKDKNARDRIHREISKKNYTNEEIEDAVETEAQLLNKPNNKDGEK
jgi:hypothetical protein